MGAGTETRVNAFGDLAALLSAEFDPTVVTEDRMQRVRVEDIEIHAQVRQEFEDADQSLDDLGDSLATGQLQNIVVRPNASDAALPYSLVIGERRLRAAKRKGVKDLWALVKVMSDEQAAAAQLSENIHRKNLTQLELAQKIQADLKALGSLEAVCAKHQKGRSWIVKLQSLLSLPPNAQRLVKENISADVEVVYGVRALEAEHPERAAELVEELKNTRGKENARDKLAAAREEVKPRKPDAKPAKGAGAPAKAGGGSVATARDRSHEEPSGARSVPVRQPHKSDNPCAEVLNKAYAAMFERGDSPTVALDALTDAQRQQCDEWLRTRFDAGKKCKGLARAIVQGLRLGQFATDGEGAFALAAFLDGAEAGVKFSLLDIFGALKL